MTIRLLSLLLIGLLMAVAGWAKDKEKLIPQTFIDRADTLYFYPQAHGVTDLAVDVTIDQLSTNLVAGTAKITMCYAGGHHGVVVSNLPEQQAKARAAIIALVDPLSEYVIPKTSVETFAGMRVSVVRATRQLIGKPNTTYYQLTGTPTDEKAVLKEYRVLVDERGLAYQVESELKDGTKVTAGIENTQMGDHWVIGKISTRVMINDNPQWEIATITYGDVNGILLPQQITVQHRNRVNLPIKELPDLTYRFSNYRINTGEAAKLLGLQKPDAAEK
jgi:hypothetical protein